MADDVLEIKLSESAGGATAPPSGSSFSPSDFSGAARIATRFATMFGPTGLASVVGRLESARHIFNEVARLTEQIATRQEKAARAEAKRIESLAKATEAAPEPSITDRLARLDDLRARRDNLSSRLGNAAFGEDAGVDKLLGDFEKELKDSEGEIAKLVESLPKSLRARVEQADKLSALEAESGGLKGRIDNLVSQLQAGSLKGNAASKAAGDIDALIGQQNAIDAEANALRSAGIRSRLAPSALAGLSAGRGAAGAAGAGAGGAGAAGAAGAAAGAGPLLAVAAGAAIVVVGLGAMAVATDRLIARFDRLSDRYGDLDPQIAAASAQRDIQRQLGDLRRANLLGEDLARFIQLRGRGEQALEDIKSRFDAVAIRLLEPALESIIALLESISRVTERLPIDRLGDAAETIGGIGIDVALIAALGPQLASVLIGVRRWLLRLQGEEDDPLGDKFFDEFFGDGANNRGIHSNVPLGQVPNLPPIMPPPPFPNP